MQLIDTHTHLNLGHFEEDQEAVIQRALDAGLVRMVTPGVTLGSCISSFDLAKRYPGLFYSALGIHPSEAHEWNDSVREDFKSLSQESSVVAIGETGLDYYWETCPPEVQQAALRAQIHFAQECQLPLIVHVRDKTGSQAAYTDLLRILQEEEAGQVGGVMHCFSGDLAFAEASLAMNFYLALGGVLTFKNAPILQEVAKQMPLEWLVLETDAPYLSPVPHRGKRNEPMQVKLVAEKLAELRQLPLETVAEMTTSNAKRLFKF